MNHIPVLLNEVLKYLDPQPNQNFIDCTYGDGGHASEILKRTAPDGKLLGIDLDQNNTQENNNHRLILINDNFANLKNIYERNFPYPLNGILCDLGVSSMELDDPTRGFSWRENGPLDMRMDTEQRLTAAEVLNKYSRDKLAHIFQDFGEVGDKLSKRVAEEIVIRRGSRRFETTFDFVEAILKTIYPQDFNKGKITAETKTFYRNRKKLKHPATRFFQAIRIEVNKELESLEKLLEATSEIINTSGRIAIISFHSLEDRLVKNYFRDWSKSAPEKWQLLTKKPITPGEEEIKINPRSRSAKLRVIKKLS